MRNLYFVLVSTSLLLISIFTLQVAVTQQPGATIELDQKTYTWTDKVNITIVAPDHNFDSSLIDTIGDTVNDPVRISTRGHNLDRYKLVETGVDTGIFTGEIILTGFFHDADGDRTTGDQNGYDTIPRSQPQKMGGPTNGFLEAENTDGITVSFEFAEDETVVASALIRWNEGKIQFLEPSYLTTDQGIVRVIDPDMNLNPEFVDSFKVGMWSNSDAGGIDLVVRETGESTGMFEGIVTFSASSESSGDRLRVADGDTVTAEYDDYTHPDYPAQKLLSLSATTFIGTMTPPLERITISNQRVVDLSGKTVPELKVNQSILIAADLKNNHGRDQSFTYIIQIQNQDGVSESLPWIRGTLAPGQSMSTAQSWTPTLPGTYSVEIHVWESMDNPIALAPPVTFATVVKDETIAFDFSVSTEDIELVAGQSQTSEISVTKKSGDAQTVSLSCTLRIQGTCDVIPSDVFPDASAKITIHTEENTQADTYFGIITGKAGNIQRSDKFTVHVLMPEESVVIKPVVKEPDVIKPENPVIPFEIIIPVVVGVGIAIVVAIKIISKPKPEPRPDPDKHHVSSVRIKIGGAMK